MKLRCANVSDVDFILAQEARDDFKPFIGRWSGDEHKKNLQEPDKRYLIAENSGIKYGYAILSGFSSPNQCLELTRFVVSEPNKGYGKQALRLILKQVFEEYNAHRLWLDVFENNWRARSVYRSLGFQEEGLLREAVKQGDRYACLVIMSVLEPEYFQRRSESTSTELTHWDDFTDAPCP